MEQAEGMVFDLTYIHFVKTRSLAVLIRLLRDGMRKTASAVSKRKRGTMTALTLDNK